MAMNIKLARKKVQSTKEERIAAYNKQIADLPNKYRPGTDLDEELRTLKKKRDYWKKLSPLAMEEWARSLSKLF